MGRNHVSVIWYRVFGAYFALAAVLLVAGICTTPPAHDILLGMGVILIAAFVPLIMAIYFVRGVRGSRML